MASQFSPSGFIVPYDPNNGFIGMQLHSTVGVSQCYSPFVFGNALYVVLQNPSTNEAPAVINVLQSLNHGQSWRFLDVLNRPVTNATALGQQSAAFYDGAQTITVCWTPANIGSSAAVQLQDFNLATLKWGAAYGAGGPSVGMVSGVFKRGDGSIVVFYPVPPSGSVSGIRASVLAAGVWSGSIACDSNVTGGYTVTGGPAAVLDPATNIIHLLSQASNGVTVIWTYQAFKADNTLGSFANDAAPQAGNLGVITNPIIVGSNLVWAIYDSAATYPGVLVGTPLNAPVFTFQASPGVDPTGPNLLAVTPNGLALATDGTTIYCVSVFQTGIPGGFQTHVRLCRTQNLANPALGWASADAYIDTAQFFTLLSTPSIPSAGVAFGLPIITLDGVPAPTPSSGAALSQFWMGGLPIPQFALAGGQGCTPHCVSTPKPRNVSCGDDFARVLARGAVLLGRI